MIGSKPSPRMAPPRALLLGVAALILLGACEGKKQAKAPDPPAVKVAAATVRTVPVYGEYVGTLEAVNSVDIRARVEGFLEERAFTDGADVKQGDLLFVIDQRPFRAALDQALAQLARDEANLAQARAQLLQSEANLVRAQAQLTRDEASLTYAQEQVERYRPLVEREFVTREAFDRYQTQAREAAAAADADRAAIKAAAAAVEAVRATVNQGIALIAADRAAVRQAELNLSYTTMSAPVSGRIGRRQVDVGNLVGSGKDTLLASIVQLDPIYVYFSPTERDLPTLLAQRGKGSLMVTVALAARAPHPHQGRVDFINNTVDPSTGTFKVRAVIPNPERLLLPGQFAQVRLLMGSRPETVLVPEQAITDQQGGRAVFVVGADKKAEFRAVVTGTTYEGMRVIEQGVKPGEEVIVDGLQKVRPGMVVDPKR